MNIRLAMPGLMLMLTLIAGCGGILSSEQPVLQVYLLEPVSLTATKTTSDHQPSLVMHLKGVPGLDSSHIQALSADAQLIQYANAQWPDFLPEVLTSVIRRSLLSTDRFAAVRTGTAFSSDDWSLRLEAQAFYGIQNVRGTTSRVSAVIGGSLLCHNQNFRLHLESSVPISEERLSVVVKAHQQALNEVTRQLWDQIESSCEK